MPHDIAVFMVHGRQWRHREGLVLSTQEAAVRGSSAEEVTLKWTSEDEEELPIEADGEVPWDGKKR